MNKRFGIAERRTRTQSQLVIVVGCVARRLPRTFGPLVLPGIGRNLLVAKFALRQRRLRPTDLHLQRAGDEHAEMSMLPRRFTTLRSAGTHRARVFHRYRPAHAGLRTLAGIIILIDHLAIGLKTAIRVLERGFSPLSGPLPFLSIQQLVLRPTRRMLPTCPVRNYALSALPARGTRRQASRRSEKRSWLQSC